LALTEELTGGGDLPAIRYWKPAATMAVGEANDRIDVHKTRYLLDRDPTENKPPRNASQGGQTTKKLRNRPGINPGTTRLRVVDDIAS
jgi:hypothetical protein